MKSQTYHVRLQVDDEDVASIVDNLAEKSRLSIFVQLAFNRFIATDEGRMMAKALSEGVARRKKAPSSNKAPAGSIKNVVPSPVVEERKEPVKADRVSVEKPILTTTQPATSAGIKPTGQVLSQIFSRKE